MQAITLRHCLIKVVTYVEISKLRFFRGEKKKKQVVLYLHRQREGSFITMD